MIEQPIEIQTPDGVAGGLLIQPEKEGRWPGVLYMTDIFGIREASRSMAGRLSAEGYAVLMPNIFYRSAKPPIFNFPFTRGDERFMNRLHEKGYIGNPKSKAKSVSLTVEGARLSEALFKKHFGVSS